MCQKRPSGSDVFFWSPGISEFFSRFDASRVSRLFDRYFVLNYSSALLCVEYRTRSRVLSDSSSPNVRVHVSTCTLFLFPLCFRTDRNAYTKREEYETYAGEGDGSDWSCRQRDVPEKSRRDVLYIQIGCAYVFQRIDPRFYAEDTLEET